MNRKWVGLAALLVVVLAGAMIAYNVLAPGVEKSENTGDSVPAAVDTDENGNADAGNTDGDADSSADTNSDVTGRHSAGIFHQRSDMGGFTARRGAQIQHPFPRLRR